MGLKYENDGLVCLIVTIIAVLGFLASVNF